jgi:hypothetical protein
MSHKSKDFKISAVEYYLECHLKNIKELYSLIFMDAPA